MPLTSEQQTAFEMVKNNRISILTGAPGVGKTYTLDELLALEAIVETPGGNGASGGWLALYEVDKDESYVARIVKEMAN